MDNVNEMAVNMMGEIKEAAGIENNDQEFLSEGEKEKIIERVKAMKGAELQLIADLIPVQFCHNRIGKELEKAKNFKKSVKESLALLEQ